MLGGAIELAMNFSVTHDFIPSVRRKRRVAQVGFLRSPCHSGRREAAIRKLEIPGSVLRTAPE
jgi:hypothetical protein